MLVNRFLFNMATSNNQFLHFNAYSIKELIVRKLTEDTNFTDQIYEGSNLNVLIDIVSYMYQCLMYNLNNAASESMFADTRLYENMNRLVKFLGYCPHGLVPSSGMFYINNAVDEETSKTGAYAGKYMLRYSAIDTGLQDANGNQVYYSAMDDIQVNSSGIDQYFRFKMHNGIWRLYPTVYTATGEDYETITLDTISSKFDGTIPQELIADGGVEVWIAEDDTGSLIRWNPVEFELFTDNKYNQASTSFAKIWDKDSNIYNLRLNENKNFEIKFGNGTIGKKLKPGNKIYIMYFETNGPGGSLDIEKYGAEGKKLLHGPELFGITRDLYDRMFPNASYNLASTDVEIFLDGITTTAIKEEDPTDIRRNAPQWFKLGQRLVTASDYEYYVKTLRKGDVLDVVCQNNFEYASTFFKWLYDLGVRNHKDEGGAQYYLNEQTLAKHNFQWADPADSNNVYLWLQMAEGMSISNLKALYIDDMSRIKSLTHNPVFLDSIDVNFSITAIPHDKLVEMIKTGKYSDQDDLINEQSYIEVTMDNNVMYASAVVANQIETIIKQYFAKSVGLGKTVNYNEILNQIYSINGIQRLRTIWFPNNNPYESIAIEGLSFATWSAQVIDAGDDLEISNTMRSLEKFQWPVLFDTNISNKIKVIKKSVNNGIRIQI